MNHSSFRNFSVACTPPRRELHPMLRAACTMLLAIAALLAVGTVQAATYIVTTEGDVATGSASNCSGTNCPTLRDAVAAANATAANDTIRFWAIVTEVTLTHGHIAINPSSSGGTLTIIGSVILSGGNASRVLNPWSGSNVTLRDLVIAKGYATFHGGGIWNDGTLVLDDVTVRDNKASGGLGGGIFNNGTLTIRTSTISGNKTIGTSDDGGGIYNNGSLTVWRSTLSSNVSARHGGGIFNASGKALTAEHSTFSGNAAAQYGGGIANFGGNLGLLFATLSGNSSADGGGALDSSGSTTLYNSVIANSISGSDCWRSSGSISAGGTLIENGIDCVSNVAGNLYDGDPDLGPLADNGGPTKTHLPQPGSVLINKAHDAPVSIDQRGEPRPMGGAMDIGAVEVVLPLFANGFE